MPKYRPTRWIVGVALSSVVLAVALQLLARPDQATRAAGDVAPQPVRPAAAPGTHPLDPAIALAQEVREHLAQVSDYTATFEKRERIGKALGEPQRIQLKLRHQSLSVYLNFQSPAAVEGREVIYVAGKNNGNLLVHVPGLLTSQLGTLELDPNGYLAMQGERHAITHIGLLGLVDQLIERGERDRRLGTEMKVEFTENVEIAGRKALRIEVNYLERHPSLEGSRAVVYLDTERKTPIRYEGYGWPENPGEAPPLVEEYTYSDIKFNVGLADFDFDKSNPAYAFP
jgi:outer membrane lipoprotein-sorting protein